VKSNCHILVIDDDPNILTNLAAYLEDEGFVVERAPSASVALEKIATTPFVVAIVDLRMPGMDGTELIRRAHESHPKMKFIIHTGSTDFRLPDEIRDLHAVSETILVKPVGDMNTFTKEIEHLLADKSK
jgi:DNA-binding NtrC family response regulator